MRVLIIGGTVFVGRHLTNALQGRGHDVVMLNRGKAAAEAFPGVERLVGDRAVDVARLGDRHFDAVVDTCGFVPQVVALSARYLAERAERYVFISSVSAHDDKQVVGDESAPLAVLPDGAPAREFAIEHYGPLKALCERAAQEEFGAERTIVIRPGLIVGPHDPTDRYSYWPHRIARGGDVLAPNSPADPMQFIDARDLAEWIVHLLESGASGAYNAVSPPRAFTIGDVLASCAEAAGSDPNFIWVEETFLEAQGVEAWMGLPLWIPASAGYPGFFDVGNARAMQSGLRMRPLVETARDTLGWLQTRPPDRPWKAGLAPEREAELLAAWRAIAM